METQKTNLFVETKKHNNQGKGYFHCYKCNLDHIYSGISPSCEYFKFYNDVKYATNIKKF